MAREVAITGTPPPGGQVFFDAILKKRFARLFCLCILTGSLSLKKDRIAKDTLVCRQLIN